PAADPGFDVIGWDSTYNGRPIPVDQMHEQVDGTVDRVRQLGGRRILEIGCGTGLLLFRLAPGCNQYPATDFSPAAVAAVAAECRRRGLPQVEVVQRRADDFTGIEAGSVDGVVLNSVLQYFPGADYLARVLAGAARAVRPGGWVFVGDVRSRPHLDLL